MEEERTFFLPFSRAGGVRNEVSLDPIFPDIEQHGPQSVLMLGSGKEGER